MSRALFNLTLILALLLQNVIVAFAQEELEPSTQQNRVFMPLVAGAPGRDPTTAGNNEIKWVTDTVPSLLSVASFAKSDASAANREIDPLQPVSLIVRLAESATPAAVTALAGVQIVHRYTKVFNGLSLITSAGQLEQIETAPGVVAVYPDQLLQPATDASPTLIGAPTLWGALGGQQSSGEDVTIGVLDSGIWPEHPSLADPDPAGKAYPAPAVAPGANGFGAGSERNTCDFGNGAANAHDRPFVCNHKLTGAYSFIDTYKAVIGLLPTEFDSARDDNGHGTHTATTAAGNAGVTASIFGQELGVVSGIAPRAHVIAYRVCGDQGCFQSDSVAAIEQAILDGVNVINYSISGGGSPYGDVVELAFLVAYDSGVFVTASSGNDGPEPNTTSHNGPWTMTVAASSNSRYFMGTLTLRAANGDELAVPGGAVTGPLDAPTPVTIAPDPLCDVMSAGSFHGEAVICARGVIGRPAKSYNVQQAGGAAMILLNVDYQGLGADNCFIPCIAIDFPLSEQVRGFAAIHNGVTATFTSGNANAVPGDVMAGFSSRGGPGQTLGVSKPDVTAPGVQILAGSTAFPATTEGGPAGELFQVLMGTSMSSPHVAGAAALLKSLHPEWTPGQIQSALMMTAKSAGVVNADGMTPPNAYDYGSGRIDLTVAGDPGVVIAERAENFVAHQNDLWRANYPSLYIPNLAGELTVERTLQDVSGAASTWRLSTVTDANGWVILVPQEVAVPAGGAASFEITVRAPNVPLGQSRFGQIYLTDGQRQLHMPVTFVRGQSPIALNHTCTPVTVAVGNVSECRIRIQNTAYTEAEYTLNMFIHDRLELVPGSVSGGREYDAVTIKDKGILRGQQPPLIDVAVDALASPAGYFSLVDFGGNTEVTLTDEAIATYVVPPFVYAGEVFDRLSIVSNGYLIAGTGTQSDVAYINQYLPDATAPNSVLAPFWTDLNPENGGQILLNFLTDGAHTWMVVEYHQVPNYTDASEVNTFQVWIGIDGIEDISFTYGPQITAGAGGLLTVGAENRFGNSGGVVYFNSDGVAPSPSYPNGEYEVDVVSRPGEPGATRSVSYQVRGVEPGYARNCARVKSSAIEGAAITCGKVRVE